MPTFLLEKLNEIKLEINSGLKLILVFISLELLPVFPRKRLRHSKQHKANSPTRLTLSNT